MEKLNNEDIRGGRRRTTSLLLTEPNKRRRAVKRAPKAPQVGKRDII